MHGAATTAALPSADAVLLVSDAAQEYTAPELEFLAPGDGGVPERGLRGHQDRPVPGVAAHRRARPGSPGHGGDRRRASSACRRRCAGTPSLHGDADVNAESGFPELVGYLRKRVLGQADRLARRGDRCTTSWPSPSRSRATCVAERTAQQDPAAAAALMPGADRGAGSGPTALKERSARWQQTLNDGVADLNADIDYDLRDRMQEISRLAEDELMDGGDPAKVWDQFAAWVQQEVASAASANFIWATQRVRCAGPAGRRPLLRRPRAAAAGAAQRPVGRDPVGAPDGRTRRPRRRAWRPKALIGLRGGYSSMLMFGMLGTFVGLRVGGQPDRRSAPRSAWAARRSATSARSGRPPAERGEGRDAPLRRRRHLPGRKDSRDRLRAVQRDLRDHFTAQADQLKRSLLESQQAAERAVKASRGRAGGPADRDHEGAGAAGAGPQAGAGAAARARHGGEGAGSGRGGGQAPMTALADSARRVLLLAIDAYRDDPADRRLAARPAAPARRAAAGRDRGQGQGGQVDAAQRARRRADRADRRGRVHPGRHLVPRRHRRRGSRCTRATAPPRPLPVRRHDGALVIDLGATSARASATGWRSTGRRRACAATTLIDTPGHRVDVERRLARARSRSSTRTTTRRPRPTPSST